MLQFLLLNFNDFPGEIWKVLYDTLSVFSTYYLQYNNQRKENMNAEVTVEENLLIPNIKTRYARSTIPYGIPFPY